MQSKENAPRNEKLGQTTSGSAEVEGSNDTNVGVDQSIWGKHWNRQTVAGHIYKDDVQTELDQLARDQGYTPM